MSQLFRPIAVMGAALGLLFAAPAAAQDADTVLYIEERLAERGYAVGEIDGVVDADATAAIRAYQEDWALPVDGVASLGLRAQMEASLGERWQAVENLSDCAVWNPFPQARETVLWTGACLDGRANGRGVETWRYYLQGVWREEVYRGPLVNGRSHGYGAFDGVFGDYVGSWSNGVFHGCGVLTLADGSVFEGEFVNGEFTGEGKCALSSATLPRRG